MGEEEEACRDAHMQTHQQAVGWLSATTNFCWQPLFKQVAVPSAWRVQTGAWEMEAAADLAALAASGLALLNSSIERTRDAPGVPLASACLSSVCESNRIESN